jgi:hypothetical protein
MEKRTWYMTVAVSLILWLGCGGCNMIGGAVAGGWKDLKDGIHRMDQTVQKDNSDERDRDSRMNK